MIHDLTLSEARSIAKERGGTYRKLSDWRYDNELHKFVHENAWTYFDWSEYYVWLMQK